MRQRVRRAKHKVPRVTEPLKYYRVLRRNFGFPAWLAGYVTVEQTSRSIEEWRERCERMDSYFEKTGRGPCNGNGK